MTIEPRARVDTASCPDRGFFTLLPLQPSLQRQCPLLAQSGHSQRMFLESAFGGKADIEI
jgi:hypothetical protein